MDLNAFLIFAVVAVALIALAISLDRYEDARQARHRQRYLEQSAQRARLELVTRAGRRAS